VVEEDVGAGHRLDSVLVYLAVASVAGDLAGIDRQVVGAVGDLDAVAA
jgi:hypothetical protein